MPMTKYDWSTRWLGGFCTLGIEEMQPVRHAAYAASPMMKTLLTLPEGAEGSAEAPTMDAVLDAWSAYLGRGRDEMPLLLVRDTDSARRLLMQAAGVTEGEAVGAPAFCRRALSESIKRVKGLPSFIELSDDLGYAADSPGLDALRIVWAQPAAGMAAPEAPQTAETFLVDYSFSLPSPITEETKLPGSATVWGLHLANGFRAAEGALIAFHGDRGLALYDQVLAAMTVAEDLSLTRALAQCERLAGPEGLAARVLDIEAQVREGMEIGAGLPMGPTGSAALPLGVPVRVPDEADMPTILAYIRSELIPVDWLPEVQPIFYVAFQVTTDADLTQRSATRASRWIFSPIGPDLTEEEVVHAVLGILKGAEYTGVRWFTNPARAKWYGDLLTEWYGPSHDAYHRAFEVPADIVPVSAYDD